jgi:hypothetical protein
MAGVGASSYQTLCTCNKVAQLFKLFCPAAHGAAAQQWLFSSCVVKNVLWFMLGSRQELQATVTSSAMNMVSIASSLEGPGRFIIVARQVTPAFAVGVHPCSSQVSGTGVSALLAA